MDQSAPKRWTLREVDRTSEFFELGKSLGFDEPLTKLLWTRGIRDFEAARRFFRPEKNNLHNPFLMTDMSAVTDRLIRAIDSGENILIYGDYDVDGTTAVALVSSYLRRYSDHIGTYIPDRYAEGYGLSEQGVRFAADNGFSVLIALDCGIKAYRQAELAKESGIDLIIGDHHTPGDRLPDAFAVLDPKRSDCNYPYPELSGCGIGFKICQALNELWGKDFSELEELLDLVTVSIGADIVPVTGENRLLAQLGLEVLNRNPRPAFKLMKEEAGKRLFDIGDIVFTIAPRINAAGRVDHADSAVRLLLAKEEENAREVLRKVNEFNTTRKELDQSITAEALEMLESDPACKHSSVVFHKSWHKGVIGIVASRLVETHYRPTVVFTESNGILAGSARSVNGFDIYDALEACADHLIQFGGHRYAAGMTLHSEQYAQFKSTFEEYVSTHIREEQKTEELLIDEILDIRSVGDSWIRRLMFFHPHGPGNNLPLFRTSAEYISDVKKIGADRRHLKFKWGEMDCIAFGMADRENLLLSGQAEIAYHLEFNEFRGVRKLQVRIVDIR